jgi:hypothetical protein
MVAQDVRMPAMPSSPVRSSASVRRPVSTRARSTRRCPVSSVDIRASGRPVSVRFRVRIGDVGDSRPLENGSDAGMCSSTAMPWTAWPLTAARTTAKRLVKGPMSSRDYAETVGHIPTGTCSVQKARSRRLIAVSAGQRLCGAPRRNRTGDPHPYHESCTHRCADQRFRRSPATVDGQVMCSSSARLPAQLTSTVPPNERARPAPGWTTDRTCQDGAKKVFSGIASFGNLPDVNRMLWLSEEHRWARFPICAAPPAMPDLVGCGVATSSGWPSRWRQPRGRRRD